MNNIYPAAESAEIRDELKQRLLELKEDVGDQDEQYPELMQVRDEVWGK